MDGEQLFFVVLIVAIITVGSAISYDTKLDTNLIENSLKRGCEVTFTSKRDIKEINCIRKGVENEVSDSQ